MSATNASLPLRVFVSSTAADLKDHRLKVIQAIQRLGHLPVFMETFGALPGGAVAECRRLVESADVVVVIVAHRYGSVPPGETKSMTWLEVEAARAAGKPVLAFVVAPTAPWPWPKEQDRLVDEPEKAAEIFVAVQALQAFKADLDGDVVSDTFDSSDDLATRVATALSRLNEDRLVACLRETPAETPDAEVVAGYLREVLAETHRIDIRGIASKAGAGGKAVSFPIEAIYTPLRSSYAPGRRGSHGRRGSRGGGDSGPLGDLEAFEGVGAGEGLELRAERVALTELLSREPHLLLVGKPGGGKTTFLRLIACVLAKDAIAADAGAGAARPPQRGLVLGLATDAPPPLPVFVRLAVLSAFMAGEPEGGDPSSARWILRWLEQRFGAAVARAVERRLDAGTAALLLDGLDEVVDERRRERIVGVVGGACARWAENLVVVTSRPHGHADVAALAGVATATVDDFGDDEIRAFLVRWVAGLHPESEDDADVGAAQDAYRALLEQAIIDHRPVRKLARNPVMLTCLSVVHWNEKRLPAGKARLLSAVVRWLIQSRDAVREKRGWTSTFADECFKTLARAMTTGADGKLAVADRAWAADALAGPFRDELGVSAPNEFRRRGLRFLEHEMLDSGVIERIGDGQLRFWHLTFQEHYAGRALAELGDGDEGADQWWPAVRDHLCDPQWFEVLDHFAGELADTGRRRLHLLVDRILTPSNGDLAKEARAVGVLGRLLRILRAYDFEPRPDVRWEPLRRRVEAIFTLEGAAAVPVKTRIVAAEALGQGGDPRLAVPLDQRMAPIPGGEGARLGIHPVTVQEFAKFVEDEGYRKEKLWEPDGWAWAREEGLSAPGSWEAQFEHLNRPVTEVSWYEAAAYCRWLAGLTRERFRLPTEAEWFAAAKNPKGEYPWGKAKPTEEHANFAPEWKANVGAPTPVGLYPRGAGPAGHLDLAGNVWEWCADDVTAEFGEDARNYADSAEKRGDQRMATLWRSHPLRALRGGGWSSPAEGLRSANRNWDPARYRDVDIGFRLALSRASR